MKISANKFVSATYDLYVGGEEGAPELMEQATAERPLSFIFGTGMMLEAFEDKLVSLEANDTFDFTLSADNAYGEYDDAHVVEIPRSVFEVDGKIDEGVIFENNTVPMMDNLGNRMNGTILKIEEEKITMDFNHPLAGEDLHFIGKIIEVREATEEEEKSFMGDDSCGCGSCGEDGCGEGGCNDEGCSGGCSCGH
jgi:FKBP-type peptidyl-prolyl cis-trans isomerase SlyD